MDLPTFKDVLDGTANWAVVRSSCAEAATSLPENTLDGAILDPPSGISFMGRTWDENKGGRDKWIAWLRDQLVPLYRALKPGAHVVVWSIPRTSHWTAMAVEDAGFDVRDVILHMFSTGFPKSMNVSKALDASAGARREVVGQRTDGRYAYGFTGNGSRPVGGRVDTEDAKRIGGFVTPKGQITAPATPEAKTWNGWGTALKPAQEMWVLARKPLSEGTIAANVLKWGTGAINIDATRVAHANAADRESHERMVAAIKARGGSMEGSWKNSSDLSGASDVNPGGRWPPNTVFVHSPGCRKVGTKKVVSGVAGANSRGFQTKYVGGGYKEGTHLPPATFNGPDGTETMDSWDCEDGCPVKALNEQSGNRKTTYITPDHGNNRNGEFLEGLGHPGTQGYDDEGGASRFFPTFSYEPDLDFVPFMYTPKPSRAEKNKGCDDLPQLRTHSTQRTEVLVCQCGSKSIRPGPQWYICAKCGGDFRDGTRVEREGLVAGNTHVTVKPVALLRWFMRLITPPGGLIADFFCGSGTTGMAARMEGVRFLGCDTDDEPGSTVTARARIRAAEGYLRNPFTSEAPTPVADPQPVGSLENLFGF